MDGDKEKVISDEMKRLMEIIEKDEHPPTDFRPNWLCGKCMNSYKSRNYALKYHKCKKRAAGSRRMKDPPHLRYMLTSRVKKSTGTRARGEKKAVCCQRKRERGEGKAVKCQRNIESDNGKATCCQRSVGRELSHLLDNDMVRKESLDDRQKECIQLYHSSK